MHNEMHLSDKQDEQQGASGGGATQQIQHQQSIPTGNGDLPHHAPPLQVQIIAHEIFDVIAIYNFNSISPL